MVTSFTHKKLLEQLAHDSETETSSWEFLEGNYCKAILAIETSFRCHKKRLEHLTHDSDLETSFIIDS